MTDAGAAVRPVVGPGAGAPPRDRAAATVGAVRDATIPPGARPVLRALRHWRDARGRGGPSALAALRARTDRARAWTAGAATWFRASLARRFLVGSLGLLAAVQLASFVVVDASMSRHVRRELPLQLAMAERTLASALDWRAQRLVEATRLLAADYGFRAAVFTHDTDTIASVLQNHGERVGADAVAVLAPDLTPVALGEGAPWDVASVAAAVARLAPAARRDGGAGSLEVVAGTLAHVVLVPIKAPHLVGWAVMSFHVPPSLATDVNSLAGADLTVLARRHARDPWRVGATGLAAADALALAGLLRDAPARDDGPDLSPATAGRDVEAVEIELARRPLVARRIPLVRARAGDPIDHAEAIAVVSLRADAIGPPREMQVALLVTSLLALMAFAIGSAYNARRITTPLHSLALAVERLGAGDAADVGAPMPTPRGHDEVRALADAFEAMRGRLAQNQARILQSEKLASIGQLAAGVAHEINNPLGFVLSNAGTLDDYLARLMRMLDAYEAAERSGDPRAHAAKLAALRTEVELDYLREDIPALMNESRDGLGRVRKIVQDLKDFSRVDTRQEWSIADVHAGLDSTLSIVVNEIRYKADVVKDYGTLPEIACRPSELNQVFMNLLVNAAQAIGPARGTIRIATAHVGDAVSVAVSDTGGGIAPDDLKRIFDPFFTTKPVGQGTGLGLSLTYGIVHAHGGRIEVESEVGKGTTFRVWLPVSRPPETA